MKSFINIFKFEKKNKNFDKIKELEIEVVEIKYSNNPNKLEKTLRELNKIEVISEKLHEIKNEKLLDYVGEFGMDGNLKVGDQVRQTHIRFRKNDDYESYINAIGGNDAKDAIFNGYISKLNSPQFNKVNRPQYGNGCDFKHEIIEYRGNNCFILTEGYCFVKCIRFLTRDDYKEQYLEFIRNGKRRSNIMTKARIQPFCKAYNFNLGYYEAIRGFPISVTDRNNAFFLTIIIFV